MILRFAPSRFVFFSAVLATSLVFVSPLRICGQSGSATHEQSPYPGTPVEEIIARVNDQVISTSDYQHALRDLEQQAQQHQWTEQQIYEQRANLLRDLIDQQLLLSRGKELGITGENELVRQLDEMRKQNHLATMDDLQKAAEAQGVSWEDFRASLRNRFITQQVIREEVGAHINISPSDIQAYYDAHKQDFDEPEQIRLSEILIPTANPDDAAQVAEAEKKADEAEARLKGGEDFASLAKSVSAGVTASNGGDLGEFKRGQLGAKVLEDQTFDLKPGQYTYPIRTKQGYVILKVTEHTPGGIAPLKDVEPQIEDQIGMSKMTPKLREYMTSLRENAYIEIKGGYEDSGASPNEMKPVYSAYTPPSRKKKKHIERTRFNGRGRRAHVETVAETTTPSTAESKKEEAKAAKATMKPGRKEKIRFGQAPRETLPSAAVKTEDADANNLGTQVAANHVSSGLNEENVGNNSQPEAKPKKTRFSAEARNHKKKQKGPKIDPFAPPPPTTQELATQRQQDQPLGLNGDTSKKKKKSSRKEGPKRRMSNEKKKEAEPSSSSPSTPAATPAASSGQ
jgi:peptidyl-prolyl cis-trans isomerase SurA